MVKDRVKSAVDQKKRLYWLDAMKAIGIILIVAGHYEPPHFEYLYTFSVQMFFIISGFLSNSSGNNNNKQFGKIVKQLVIPMFLLAVIYNVLFAIVQILLGNMNLTAFIHNLWGIVVGDAFALAGLWFVYTLIFVKILTIFLHKYSKPFVAVLCVVTSVILHHYSYGDYYNCYVNALLAYPCFYIGEIAGNYKERIDNINNKVLLISLIFSGLIVSLVAYNHNDTIWMYNGVYGSNILLFFIGSMAGTIMCFAICKLLLNRKTKYIMIIYEGTILILAFHGLIIRLTHHVNIGVAFYPISVLLVIIFIPFILLCKKYFPILLGFRGIKPTNI